MFSEGTPKRAASEFVNPMVLNVVSLARTRVNTSVVGADMEVVDEAAGTPAVTEKQD